MDVSNIDVRQMLNLWSSPGDPLFYLHHAYLDKLWWQWQAMDLPLRLQDITGSNQPVSFGPFPGTNGSFPGFPGNGSIPGFPGNGTFPPGGPGNGSCGMFPGGPFPPVGTGPPRTNLVKRDGDPGNVTTLGHVLTMFGMMPNVTVADVMDVQGGLLCYEYI